MSVSAKETYLILVKYLAVMEVGMREYPIDATTDRAQFGHWRLLDAHPGEEIRQRQLRKTGAELTEYCVSHMVTKKAFSPCVVHYCLGGKEVTGVRGDIFSLYISAVRWIKFMMIIVVFKGKWQTEYTEVCFSVLSSYCSTEKKKKINLLRVMLSKH